jgi:hypothetical protein
VQRPRTPFPLSKSLHRRLNSYALAASAGGVSLLASAQPAAAKIVYTSTHVQILYQNYNLDLDHDGLIDFTLLVSCNCTNYHNWSTWWSAGPAQSKNQVWGGGGYASALKPGVRIGPEGKFSSGKKQMAWFTFYASSSNGHGPWKNVRDRYLGLKFVRHGKIHYGWARLSVSIKNGIEGTLTGYAYETIPNKPIIAGKTRGADDYGEQPNSASLTSPTPEPVSLGRLALGSSGLAFRKREESAGAAH